MAYSRLPLYTQETGASDHVRVVLSNLEAGNRARVPCGLDETVRERGNGR